MRKSSIWSQSAGHELALEGEGGRSLIVAIAALLLIGSALAQGLRLSNFEPKHSLGHMYPQKIPLNKYVRSPMGLFLALSIHEDGEQMYFCYLLCFGHGSRVCKSDSSGDQLVLLGTTAVPERRVVVYPKPFLEAKGGLCSWSLRFGGNSVLGFLLSCGAGILRGIIG